MIENVKTEMINIFLEKLILLDKINKPKIEYLKGYMDAKINEKEEKLILLFFAFRYKCI